MPYNSKALLRDVNGDPIPQYYDPVEDVFMPITNPAEVQVQNFPVTQDVKLTANKVTEISFLLNLQIRNTTFYYLPSGDSNATNSILNAKADVSNFKEESFHVYNSLNQSVSITVFIARATGTSYVDAAPVSGSPINIAAGARKRITSADIPELSRPHSRVYLGAQCAIAPTLGALNVYLEGQS